MLQLIAMITSVITGHKGKATMITILTAIGLYWAGIHADVLPVLATEAFVMQTVDDKTKGLDYLVRTAYEKDLDALRYSVDCMNNVSQSGALSRLEDDYEKLYGKRYVHKTCQALQQIIQIRQGE